MFDHLQIEKKWQDKWDQTDINAVTEDESYPDEKRFYCLDMFPYPSGAGLHVGHPEGYTASDILSRYKRMKGFNVLHPMGWDAFGLPAENYAIKTGVHPAKVTTENIENFKRQIKALGFSYDWNREVNTTDPEYFHWTQWIFLKLFEKGLAYEAELPINWCPSCKTGLANEEVDGSGKCDRCGEQVEKKNLRQWVLKITAYADRLLDELELVDWPEAIKIMQRNWIGRSEGAEVKFTIEGHEAQLNVYTTRPDTLYGATYMVLAPEHPLLEQITSAEQKQQVQDYIRQAATKSDLQRTELQKEKTGVFSGAYAINPVNEQKIPIWVADYVLISYGTGAIMAVPAHDERDYEFARTFDLPIIQVVSDKPDNQMDLSQQAFTEKGFAINSAGYDGLPTDEFKQKITADLEARGQAKKAVNYKLRDWLFSRQRYWGEPIPLVHCEKCGVVALDESELPLKLPEVERYEPTGTGESPLAGIEEWVNTSCPKCSGPAKRETNTMPQWAGSCWYYLRYIDPKNNKELADPKKLDYWLPVDHYIGGAEHAVLHLLYSRFWHKFLNDIGVVPGKEPFQKLTNQGLILAEDGQKMSKSLGNVINPDDVIQEYGADTMRIYEMFMGPLEMAKPWDTKGIIGVRRFLDKIWKIAEKNQLSDQPANEDIIKQLHKTIKKVGEDIENLRFNTGISAMMILINSFQKIEVLNKDVYLEFLKLLAPYAPHLAEELWEMAGEKYSIHQQAWPEYDQEMITDDMVTIVYSVNGKVRGKEELPSDISGEELEKKALTNENVLKHIRDKEVVKVIVVPAKMVNIVIK